MPYVEKDYSFKKYEKKEQEKNKPLLELKDGSIKVVVWNNKGMKTIEVYRFYKDKQGKWKKTNSFNKRDLLRLSLMLEEAYKFLKN